MNCAEARPLLDACLDGELDLVHAVAVEQHLETCAACRSRRDRTVAMTALLRARVPHPPAPAGLRERVQATIRAEMPANAAVAANVVSMPMRPPAMPWIAMAAGIAVLLGLAFTFLPKGSQGDGLAPLFADALNSHRRAIIAGPLVAVASSDRHTVKPWLAARLDFSPPVPDLAAVGFPLIGGRLDYVGQRPVAALVYQRRDHRIEVFVSPAAGDSAPVWSARDGFRMGYWTHGGMRFVAVSDLSEPEIREFVERLRAGEAG